LSYRRNVPKERLEIPRGAFEKMLINANFLMKAKKLVDWDGTSSDANVASSKTEIFSRDHQHACGAITFHLPLIFNDRRIVSLLTQPELVEFKIAVRISWRVRNDFRCA
jgi:hypothetical protein